MSAQRSHPPPYSEAESETYSEAELAPAKPPPVPRPRDLIFDALCLAEGIPLDQIGSQGGRIAKAKKEIVAITPDITPDEIDRRARNYRTHFDGAALTATALAKHWGRCHVANLNGHPAQPPKRGRVPMNERELGP